jgi:multidrug efflux pump subunit AcrA (membrane-fusion protein)
MLSGAVTGLLVLAVGLIGGFVAGKQASAPEGGGHAEGEPAAAGGDEHASHEGAPGLTPQTLANLGIETGELKATEFVRAREVAAVVVEPRGSRRRAYAPVAGLLRRVLVRPGSVVKAGDPVAEILRDPFPRPTLTLTDSLLRSLDEEFHRALADLRTSSLSVELARAELERVRKIIGASGTAGSLPTKTEIDLQREAQRAERALENARYEGRRHGLTADEVAGIEAGTTPAPQAPDVQRVLDARRLWGPPADRALALLPDGVRSAPFAVALVGELFSASLLSPEFEEALRSRLGIRDAFLDVAGLIQAGETVEGVLSLEAAGGLRSTVLVRAPADAPDWDVIALDVVSGAHVSRGGRSRRCSRPIGWRCASSPRAKTS